MAKDFTINRSWEPNLTFLFYNAGMAYAKRECHNMTDEEVESAIIVYDIEKFKPFPDEGKAVFEKMYDDLIGKENDCDVSIKSRLLFDFQEGYHQYWISKEDLIQGRKVSGE